MILVEEILKQVQDDNMEGDEDDNKIDRVSWFLLA